MRAMTVCSFYLVLAAFFTCPNEARATNEAPYSVVFEHGNAKMAASGADVATNAAATTRIATVIRRLSGLKGLRFVFVGKRPTCTTGELCDSARLGWDRVQHVTRAIADQLSEGEAMPYRNIGFAFADELPEPVSLPAAATDREALTLFINADEHSSSGDCKARVILNDPDLPSMLHGRKLVIESGEQVRVSARAVLSIEPPLGAPSELIWSDGQGRFMKWPVEGTLMSRSIPNEGGTLFLLPKESASPELASFVASLDETYTFQQVPSFLVGEIGEYSERSIGDNVKPVPPGTVRPKRKTKGASIQEVSCKYTFSALR